MAWSRIDDPAGVEALRENFGSFHDACIKEARYVSGAYVNAELAMRPFNEVRELRLVLQRQERDPAAIELVFEGVDCFHLEPADEEYDCCIFDAFFKWVDDRLWWCNWLDFDPEHPPLGEQYTWVCARAARWQEREDWLGEAPVYGPLPRPL